MGSAHRATDRPPWVPSKAEQRRRWKAKAVRGLPIRKRSRLTKRQQIELERFLKKWGPVLAEMIREEIRK